MKVLILRVHTNGDHDGPSHAVVPLEPETLARLRAYPASLEQVHVLLPDVASVRVIDYAPTWLESRVYDEWRAAQPEGSLPTDEEVFDDGWLTADVSDEAIEALGHLDQPRLDGEEIIIYEGFFVWTCCCRYDGNVVHETELVHWSALDEM